MPLKQTVYSTQTCDWGSSNHVGLSEFVLHGRKEDGSTISVGTKSVKTTAEYFAQ